MSVLQPIWISAYLLFICAMGNFLEITCLLRSSLINVPRRPRSSGRCGLGKVGLLVYSDPPLTHSLSISSRWILAIVATAWAASITTYVTLFALGSSAYTNGMLSQFAAVLSNT